MGITPHTGNKTPWLIADTGEGMGNEEALMPYIDAASIACGYHAGDEGTIKNTLQLCQQYQVMAGAHPSFPDREYFGRRAMNLSPAEIYNLVREQLLLFSGIASPLAIPVHHVKPHGALYNISARNPSVAASIARAVADHNPSLLLVGLSGSCSLDEARKAGLSVAPEFFADRGYREDGSLLPRTEPGALITDPAGAGKRLKDLLAGGYLFLAEGKKIPLEVEAVCVHGDNPAATGILKSLRAILGNKKAQP